MAGEKIPLDSITGPDKIPLADFTGQGVAPPSDPLYQNLRTGKDAGISGSFGTGFSTSDDETIRFLASRLYPDDDLEQAISRFGMRDGDIYHKADDGNLYHAVPSGWGPRDLLAWATSGAGKLIPIASGAAAGIITAPTSITGPAALAASIGAVGVAGGAGEALRQQVGDVMYGPEVSTVETEGIGMQQVAAEAGAGLMGQGLGGGIAGRAGKRAVKDVAKLDPAKTRAAYDEAAGQGIKITPAEATGLPTLAAQQKRLGNITATSDEMAEFYARRDLDVYDALNRGLDDISKYADAEDVGRLARAAAQDHLEDLRLANLAKAKPYYDKAFAEGDKEIWTPELETLSGAQLVQKAMHSAVTTWQDTAIADGFGAMNPGAMVEHGIIKFKGGKIPAFPNLQYWDYVKRSLDDAYDASLNQTTGKPTHHSRNIAKITKRLRDELDKAAPDSYAEARSVYGTGAENVQAQMQSALGIIAEMKDTGVMSAARQTFNPATRTPQMVSKLRKAIESKDPAAWQALKRLYLRSVAKTGIESIAESGEVLNPAGKLHKAFASPPVRANLRAAMTGEEWANFNSLTNVYKRAASIKKVGSDTAFNQLETQEATKAAKGFWLKAADISFSPNRAIRAYGEWKTEQNMDKLAMQSIELITSGSPEAIKTMRELRRLSPADKSWKFLFGHLISQGTFGAGKMAASEIAPGADRQPDQPH